MIRLSFPANQLSREALWLGRCFGKKLFPAETRWLSRG